MDTLKGKIMRKYKSRGLSGHFVLRMEDCEGTIIQRDEDIVKYLTDLQGELQITPE